MRPTKSNSPGKESMKSTDVSKTPTLPPSLTSFPVRVNALLELLTRDQDGNDISFRTFVAHQRRRGQLSRLHRPDKRRISMRSELQTAASSLFARAPVKAKTNARLTIFCTAMLIYCWASGVRPAAAQSALAAGKARTCGSAILIKAFITFHRVPITVQGVR